MMNSKIPQLDIIVGDEVDTSLMPTEATILNWAHVVLAKHAHNASMVALKVVSLKEMVNLNSTFRNKNKATNVLSFPLGTQVEDGQQFLGDIAICLEVVDLEASVQGKSLNDHFAHLLVHGILHLLGYDHVDDVQAEEMEALETDILNTLTIAAPYESVLEERQGDE